MRFEGKEDDNNLYIMDESDNDNTSDNDENQSVASIHHGSHDDSDEEGEETTIEDFARNPMMERVQRALKEQLKNTYDRIKRDSEEQQQEVREAKKKREDCGVELYGMQQQLARLQTGLDSANEDRRDLIDNRKKGEKNMEAIKNVLLQKKRELNERTKSLSKRKEELDELLSSTRQARLFDKETKDEVAISKRAASKAEETVKGLQKGKFTQDLYIDSIYERIRSLEQDTSLSEDQVRIQKKLTINADRVIKETITDLEALVFEKQQLVQQWDSSIRALGRRDQALTAVSKAMKKAEDTTKDHKSEILGLHREMKRLNDGQETMLLRRNKLESEEKFIEDELQRAELDQESIAGRFEIVSKTVSKTLEEEAMIEKAVKKKRSEILSLSQKIEIVTRERKELDDK
jgi:chromosome segregation ATPase